MSSTDTLDLLAQRRNRILNTLHTWLLGAGSLLLLAVTAWAFGGTMGIVYAVAFGLISMLFVRRISPQMVLTMYKARPVSEAQFPIGVRIVRELAVRANLPAVPTLHIIPSKMMNAFAVGRRDESAIAITDALARTLSTRELAGVLAHEMSHIAHEDVKVMAFADMVSRFTSLMSTVGLLSLLLNLGSYFGGMGEPVPWLAVVVLIAAPTVGGLLQMALSRTREFDADLGAAMLTGDPDGLASALAKLERAHGRLWEGMVLPGGRIPNPSVLRTHPQTADRVAQLMALKGVVPAEPPVARAPVQRPPLVPQVRLDPHHRLGLYALVPDPETDGIDGGGTMDGEAMPAATGSLNPPEGDPRIRLTRGGVWW